MSYLPVSTTSESLSEFSSSVWRFVPSDSFDLFESSAAVDSVVIGLFLPRGGSHKTMLGTASSESREATSRGLLGTTGLAPHGDLSISGSSSLRSEALLDVDGPGL